MPGTALILGVLWEFPFLWKKETLSSGWSDSLFAAVTAAVSALEKEEEPSDCPTGKVGEPQRQWHQN